MTQNLQVRAFYMQNFEMKKVLDPKVVTFWVRCLKNSLGNLGPKDVSRHKSRNLAPAFTNGTSFSPE